MSTNAEGRNGRGLIADAVSARRRADLVAGLRDRVRGADRAAGGGAGAPRGPALEHCDICGVTIPEDHRHLLHVAERRIVCSCEACWALRSGEGDYRPTGSRTIWLPELDVPDELWASLQIPIGLAFFMRSSVTECVVALYPSPAGATESELHFESWSRMCELNPVLAGLDADIEGLIVNRLTEPPMHVIAPIDRCYALTGAIKASWEGISGGSEVTQAVAGFFERLRGEGVRA